MKKRDAKRKWNLQKRAREKFVHGNEPFQTSSEQIAEDEERRARIAEQEREAKRKEREAKEQERKRMAECITGSEEALATLKKIEEDKMLLAKERRQAEEDKKRQEKERKHFWDDIDGEDEEMEDGEEQSEDEDDSMAVNTNAHVAPNNPPPAVVAEPNAEQQQAQKPAVPAVPATPPQTRRWGLGSVLNTVKQFIPRLATPYLTQEPPATAPPATHDPATETMDISESPSHARAQRQPSKLRRKKSRKDNRSRLPPLKTKFQADKAYARTLLKRVPDEQRPAVQSWYDDIRAKAEENCRVRTGDKRKRIEEAPKIDELASIPSHPPWQSNGYGLTEGFFDYSDSESDDQGGAKGRGVVPEYYQKYLQAEHPDSPPAKKKYKTAHTDSFGRSTSRTDLHPRPSFMPSPMFENFGHQYQGGNVFQQDDVAKPKDSNDKQLKRTGHIPGTGTFCVPECDSDDEGSTVLDGEASNEAKTSTSAESVKGKAGSPTNYKAPTVEDAPASSSDASSDVSSDGSSNFKPWTQQPPPAPTPAHASLPGMTPADGSTSSPQKVSPQLSATVPAAKPATGSEAESVKRQRERLEKYKPAIPSGLRESSRLSTSTVNSDGSGDAETISSNTGPSLGSGLLTQAYDAKSPPKIAPSAEKKNGSQTSREIVPPEPVPDRYGGILFDVDRGHLTGNGRFWNIEYPSAPEKAYTSMFIGPLPEPDLLDGDEEVLQAVSQAVMKNPLFAEQSVEYFYGKDSGFDQFEKGLFEDDEDMTDLDLADDTSESEEDGVFPQSDPRAKTIKEMDRLMAGANKK
ncbi:hypothetical protein AOQ84DRAFT_98710 [Glonium stellatum]|uniref:Uncharacterized protein n=1 Tax=Glonium stellatum TaxID=574774 RepID=A0A8E2EV07_9PEZI|nr:hypothetical protein AOQ84DRAFT_98710 [Glonium stellatum]